MNAFVTSAGPGYMFYDVDFINLISSMAMNAIAGQWLLAHEAGHNMQLAARMSFQYQINTELSADCFSGYYLGSRVCEGDASEADVMVAVQTACNFGDPMGLPWFDPRAHGNCQMRASAVQMGLQSYRMGVDPRVACAM